MTTSRWTGWSALVFLAFAALATVVAGAAPPAQTPGAPKSTFGKQPCGRLVSIEEVEAVFKAEVPMIEVVEEGTCVYEAKPDLPLFRVKLTSGSGLRCTAKDGTYLGRPTEPVAGIGDRAVWSGDVGTICFVRGDARVQLSFDSALPEGTDRKTVAVELARKAAARLQPRKGP